MQRSTLKRLRFLPLILILIGGFEAGRQLVKGGLDGLVQLAQGCRDLLWAGPRDFLLFFPIYLSDFAPAFWWVVAGFLLWVIGRAIFNNWEFFEILNFYCNLVAHANLGISRKWIFVPLKVFLFIVALAILPVHYLLARRIMVEKTD